MVSLGCIGYRIAHDTFILHWILQDDAVHYLAFSILEGNPGSLFYFVNPSLLKNVFYNLSPFLLIKI